MCRRHLGCLRLLPYYKWLWPSSKVLTNSIIFKHQHVRSTARKAVEDIATTTTIQGSFLEALQSLTLSSRGSISNPQLKHFHICLAKEQYYICTPDRATRHRIYSIHRAFNHAFRPSGMGTSNERVGKYCLWRVENGNPGDLRLLRHIPTAAGDCWSIADD